MPPPQNVSIHAPKGRFLKQRAKRPADVIRDRTGQTPLRTLRDQTPPDPLFEGPYLRT
jgi:hypothetical protein